jgi:hypothetical protein
MTERALDPFVKCSNPAARETLRKHLPRILNAIKRANPIGYVSMTKTQFAIFNLDGTVCNDAWRRPRIIPEARFQPYYDDGAIHDMPTQGIFKRIHDLLGSGVKLVFFGSRALSHWDMTVQWLKVHFGIKIQEDYELFLMPNQPHVPIGCKAITPLDMKKMVVRTLRARPDSEILNVFECDPVVIDALKKEAVPVVGIDAEEGDVHYMTEEQRKSYMKKSFLVRAEDTALRATKMMQGIPGIVAPGRFEVVKVDGVAKTPHQLCEEGTRALAEQINLRPVFRQEVKFGELPQIQGDPENDRFLNAQEVHEAWGEQASAAHAAEREQNHYGRVAGEERKQREQIKKAYPVYITEYVKPEPLSLADIINPKIANGEFLDAIIQQRGLSDDKLAPRPFMKPIKTAQEAVAEAAEGFPFGTIAAPVDEAAKALDDARKDSSDVATLMQAFFPDGMVLETAYDHQLSSLFMTALYAMKRFADSYLTDETALQQAVLFLSSMEPILTVGSISGLDD